MNHRDLVTTFYNEVLVNRDLTAVDRYVHPDFHSNTAARETSRDALKEYLAENLATTQVAEISNLVVMADGDMVVVLQRISGRVDGEPVAVRSADFYRVQDGLLAEHWDAGYGFDE
jgi:predicted SnoaL-like aldol condensation-catalyzing enzyme